MSLNQEEESKQAMVQRQREYQRRAWRWFVEKEDKDSDRCVHGAYRRLCTDCGPISDKKEE